LKALCLVLCLAGGELTPKAPTTERAVRPRAAAFDLMPPKDGIQGQPIHILVGIRNTSREPLAFVVEPGTEGWIKSTSYQLESSKDEDRGIAGGTQGGAAHALQPGQRWCPSGQELLLLPPGSRLYRMHEIELDPRLVGKVLLEVKVRLIKADPSLACGPAEFLEGAPHARFVVRPR
jgi:hypothetical protein